MSKKILAACTALAAFAAFAVVPARAAATLYFGRTEEVGSDGFDDFTTRGDQLNHTCTVIDETTLQTIHITGGSTSNSQATKEMTVQSASSEEVTVQVNDYLSESNQQSNEDDWTYEASELKTCLT